MSVKARFNKRGSHITIYGRDICDDRVLLYLDLEDAKQLVEGLKDSIKEAESEVQA